MRRLFDFLRKILPGQSEGRRIVQVVDETVTIKESGAAVGPARVIDPAAWIGCALLFVAFVVDFGIADYFGLPIPIAVGKWAWGVGMLFVAPKLLIWANRLKRRVVPISMHVMAKAVPTVKKRVIPAGDEKKPKAEESGQEGTSIAEWDVFICHASEDKEDFVRSLAEGLEARGLRVWFDEFKLTVGDSLRRSIDLGLSKSRFGVVVISPNFLRKEWPQRELDGLVAREVAGVKVILPVWHRITADEVRAYSPTLADRVAAPSDKGLEEVIAELMQAIRRDEAPNRTDTGSVPSPSPMSDVRVILRGPARRARFIIENLGPGIVQDVHFEVDEQEGKKSPLVANDCKEKLPVPILRPGARWELVAALTFDTGITFTARWWWREEDGRVEERVEKIALQDS